jgi:F420-0:gamma-glutamyl ligase-like protein
MCSSLSTEGIRKIVEEEIGKNINIKMLQSMQKLDVKDGDIVVISYPERLTPETMVNIRNAIEGVVRESGRKVSVMVMDSNASIGVLSKREETTF